MQWYDQLFRNHNPESPIATWMGGEDCFPPAGKTGDQKSVAVKIQDCISVTSSFWETSARCDELKIVEIKSSYHAGNMSMTHENMGATKELIMKSADDTISFRLLPVRQRVSAYFNGEDFCVAVWSKTLTIVDDGCKSACVSYKSGTPIMLNYYHVNDYQETVKTLKFFVSTAASINASIKIWMPLMAILFLRLH